MKVLSTTSKSFPQVLEMVSCGKLSVQDVSEICIISRPAEVILMQAEEGFKKHPNRELGGRFVVNVQGKQLPIETVELIRKATGEAMERAKNGLGYNLNGIQ
jgi:hypothetical protein